MSMDINTFEGRCQNIIDSFQSYANLATEANQIRVALGADATTHDTTISTAPVGLQPGNKANSPFMDALLLEVNKGKAGNLSNITMANVIGGLVLSPPINTVAPVITYVSGGTGAGTVGAQYALSAGTWNPSGTRANQWQRNNVNIPGATAAAYTAVDADGGNNIRGGVIMSNAAGSNTAYSAPAAIAAP